MTEGLNIAHLVLQEGIEQPYSLGQGPLEKFLLAYKHPEPKTVGLVVYGNVVDGETERTLVVWYKPNSPPDVKAIPGGIIANKDYLLKYCSDPGAPADAIVYTDGIAKEDLQKMLAIGGLVANIYMSFRALERITSESTGTQQPKGTILYVAHNIDDARRAAQGQRLLDPRQGR